MACEDIFSYSFFFTQRTIYAQSLVNLTQNKVY